MSANQTALSESLETLLNFIGMPPDSMPDDESWYEFPDDGKRLTAGVMRKAKAALAAQDGPDEMDEPLYRVVCAAIRHHEYNGLIICGHRHYDLVMKGIRDAIHHRFYDGPWEDGFLNNKGEFITRAQAWVIARKAGQIRRLVGSQTDSETGELFSENLY